MEAERKESRNVQRKRQQRGAKQTIFTGHGSAKTELYPKGQLESQSRRKICAGASKGAK